MSTRCPASVGFCWAAALPIHCEEFGKLRNVGHMGHVREYSAREVARMLEACGLAVQSIDYRYHANARGWKGKLLRAGYRLAPRRFRREIVMIARKARAGPAWPRSPEARELPRPGAAVASVLAEWHHL